MNVTSACLIATRLQALVASFAAACVVAAPLAAAPRAATTPEPSLTVAPTALDSIGCATPLEGNACIRLDCGGDCAGLAIDPLGQSFSLAVDDALLDAMGYGGCSIRDLDAAVELTGGGVNTVTLSRGSSDVAVLWTGGGVCPATSVDATFDDEAAPAANGCPAAGKMRANDPLSLFDGKSLAATWAVDVGGSPDVVDGTFGSWRLAADVQCATRPPGNCTANVSTACLNRSRFRVRMTYRTAQGTTGQAHANLLTPDTGWFWFFDRKNVEVVVKVINGCALNQRFWVFASGLTNVHVAITVVDTVTGRSKTYQNPLDIDFRPIQDTGAFPCS